MSPGLKLLHFSYSIIALAEPLDAISLLPAQLNIVATFYLG